MGSDKVYFFFISGAKKGKIEAASPANGVIRIGRQHYCEVQLDPFEDIPASGNHARVVRDGMGWALVDSGSSWGTWKNDMRVSAPVPITTGDVITCGQDDRGRQGPQIRFYLDKDILRCPSCEGPVYKRHFKCPSCKHKFCLRCIDFRTKTCKPCAPRASGGAYDIVPDATPAQDPTRVVVTGADAERARQAGMTGRNLGPPPGPPPIGLPPPTPPPFKQTRVMGGARGPGAPIPGSGAEPFCRVCCDFVSGPTFTCPVCRQTACASHQHGSVCAPCAGMASGVGDREVGRISEPEVKVPSLVGPNQVGPPPPPPPIFDDGVLGGDVDEYPSGHIPPTERLPKQDEDYPATGMFPAGGPGREDPYFGDKIDARRPIQVLCERCKSPLSPRDFFVCDRCHQRLCAKHRPVEGDTCRECQVHPSSQSLPQDLIQTAGDEAGLRPPANLGLSDSADPLSGVQFECPYCDAPIERNAQRCSSCRRDL